MSLQMEIWHIVHGICKINDMDIETSRFITENVQRIKEEKIQKAIEVLMELEEQTPKNII